MIESFLSSPSSAWYAFGLLCIVLEVVTGGFWMLFTGLSALVTGALAQLGALPTPEWRLAVFAVIALFSTLVIRRLVVKKMSPGGPVQATRNAVGETVTVVAAISADTPGQVEYQGAPWTALSDAPLAAGARAKIIRQDGMRFFVTKA